MRVRRSLRLVETTVGAARVHLASPAGASGAPLVALGHGAGGGVDSWDLQQVAAACIDAGCRVALIEQPWRVAGRRIAPRPATLDAAWVEVLASFRPAGPLVVGGRSAGARVACRTAGRVGAAGVLALAFPLHPPGRPGVSRERELADASCPVLVVQGDRDPFGTAAEIRDQVPSAAVVEARGGDHSLVRGDFTPVLPRIVEFLRRLAE